MKPPRSNKGSYFIGVRVAGCRGPASALHRIESERVREMNCGHQAPCERDHDGDACFSKALSRSVDPSIPKSISNAHNYIALHCSMAMPTSWRLEIIIYRRRGRKWGLGTPKKKKNFPTHLWNKGGRGQKACQCQAQKRSRLSPFRMGGADVCLWPPAVTMTPAARDEGLVELEFLCIHSICVSVDGKED